MIAYNKNSDNNNIEATKARPCNQCLSPAEAGAMHEHEIYEQIPHTTNNTGKHDAADAS